MLSTKSPAEAVKVALELVGSGMYMLGTGNNKTLKGGMSDCWGFVGSMCYGLPRHLPGFNTGRWASVSDDLNCNSAIEDADNKQEIFELVQGEVILPGDILAYSTITAQRFSNTTGGSRVVGPWIGHCAIVVSSTSHTSEELLYARNGYHLLEVVQCCGPNGHSPAIIKTSGGHWDLHDHQWPTHKTRVLRVKRGMYE